VTVVVVVGAMYL